MTEDEARAWLADRWPPAAISQLESYVALLIEANASQNLISRSSIETVWVRHIADSAQLLTLTRSGGNWLDVGSGAGLPGIVVAILTQKPVSLIEPRAKRSMFLRSVIDNLGLRSTEVVTSDIARVSPQPYACITARAFAPLEKIFAATWQFGQKGSQWLLPKGQSARLELDQARRNWQGSFHVEQSITDIQAGIVVASNLRPRVAP